MIRYKVTITFKDYKELELVVTETKLDNKRNILICSIFGIYGNVSKYYIMLDTVILFHIEELK